MARPDRSGLYQNTIPRVSNSPFTNRFDRSRGRPQGAFAAAIMNALNTPIQGATLGGENISPPVDFDPNTDTHPLETLQGYGPTNRLSFQDIVGNPIQGATLGTENISPPVDQTNSIQSSDATAGEAEAKAAQTAISGQSPDGDLYNDYAEFDITSGNQFAFAQPPSSSVVAEVENAPSGSPDLGGPDWTTPQRKSRDPRAFFDGSIGKWVTPEDYHKLYRGFGRGA